MTAACKALAEKDKSGCQMYKFQFDCFSCCTLFCTSLLFIVAADKLERGVVGVPNSTVASKSVSPAKKLPTTALLADLTNVTKNSFEMPGVGHTRRNKEHNLWYSAIFYAPRGVAAKDLAHHVSKDGMQLVIDYQVPSGFTTAPELLNSSLSQDPQNQSISLDCPAG